MSVEIVNAQFKKFISTENPEVMALKGHWGVGKTYTLNKFLRENHKDIKLQKYSYVSLFGLKSIETLKYAIFENAVKKESAGIPADAESLKDFITERPFQKYLKFANLIPKVNTTAFIEAISAFLIKNMIVCLDDIERRGNGLQMTEIMGLASFLKDQRNCKVIIILNDEKIGTNDEIEHYKKYREKVIDSEVDLIPTPEESASIAFPDTTYLFNELKKLSKKLGIRNIRILKKIRKFVDSVKPIIEGRDAHLIENVIHSIVLFTWCHFSKGDNPPSPEFVIRYCSENFRITRKEDKENETDSDEIKEEKKKQREKEENWRTILSTYNYVDTYEIDQIISDSVGRGYIIESEFKKSVDKREVEIKTEKARNKFTEAWDIYRGSFENNEEELIGKLYECFKENTPDISVDNLNSTVTLFRDLGKDIGASEIIDFYIEYNEKTPGIFNLDKNNVFNTIYDTEIVSKFNMRFKSLETTENAETILNRIAGKGGWNQEDEVVLLNTTPEEYIQIFKKARGEKLRETILAALQFGQLSNASERHKQISYNAKKALEEIGRESPLNNLRISKLI